MKVTRTRTCRVQYDRQEKERERSDFIRLIPLSIVHSLSIDIRIHSEHHTID
jgi:hypothetical protein